MIYKNLITAVIFSCLFVSLGKYGVRIKRYILFIGCFMNTVALILLGLFTDVPQELKVSEYYTYYIAALLILMMVFGTIIIELDNRNHKK